jgi:hypothetical protein
LNITLRTYIIKIIHDIWKKNQRVTYIDFVENLSKNHPIDEPLHIPKQTFSRILKEFLQLHSIKKYNNSELYIILQEPIQQALYKGVYGRDEIKNYVRKFLRIKKIYSPSPLELDRIINNIIKNSTSNAEAENINLISKLIGKDITSLEFVKEFENNNRYTRFPPIYEGKLGVKKLTSEYDIFLQIKEIFQKEGIEFDQLIQLSDIHYLKELIEKLHPSEAIRSSKQLFAIHLLKYYTARYQDSIDAIVKCFIKSARLMRFRANKSYDERSGKDSRSFLVQNNEQFQDILNAMKADNRQCARLDRIINYFVKTNTF